MQVERSILVERPIDEVFAFVSDPANLTVWQPEVSEVRADGPLAAGSTFVEVRSFLGKRFESTLEVSELEPPRVFSLRVVKGPVKMAVRHDFQEEGEATRVTIAGEGDVGPLGGLASGLIARKAAQRLEGDLGRLKQVLESRSS